jgi:hypothetical protein
MSVDTLADLVVHAHAIRRLGWNVVRDAIEIGERLAKCKRLCGHGNWLPWLKREFPGWSEDTAERFIQVAALSNQIPQLAELNLPISALYLVSRPSTSPAARDAIIERAQAGETLPVAEVKAIIQEHKTRPQPVHVHVKPAPAPPQRDLVAECVLLVKRMSEEERRHFVEVLRELDLLEEPEPKPEEPADEIVELPKWRQIH